MGAGRNQVFKRLGVGLAQHCVAALFLLLLAGIIFNSFLSVSTMKGHKTYYLDPLSQNTAFEESEVFQDLFQTSVQDIIQLAIIRDQMETDGKFYSAKRIDVTAFMKRYGNNTRDYGQASVSYELEDLIKWGRYGVEYRNRVMSLSDFVNYYGEACVPENYALDGSGNLYFKGFQAGKQNRSFSQEAVEEKMRTYSTSQLEDMAFSYIMGMTGGDGISMMREDDGNLSVYINALTCRYQTIDRRSQLFESVTDWAEFLTLQRNVADTIQMLTENYELYQACISLYEEGNSNLKYVVRFRDSKDRQETFSNAANFSGMDEDVLTELFADYRRYLIYYPDSLDIMGNTELSEGDIYEYMRQAHYPYPEDTYLWIALDHTYENQGDAFYYANEVFERVVPYTTMILTALVILFLLWIGMGLYLTVTAGVIWREDGTQVYGLNRFDHMWTELLVLLAAAFCYGTYRGYRYLEQIADLYYERRMDALGAANVSVYQYGSYALFGFAVSLWLGLVWYSFIRRIKNGSLYRDSLAHNGILWFAKVFESMMGHQNSIISVLLPYNSFLLINLFAIIGMYNLKEPALRILLLLAIVGFDTVIGILLFKNSAERNDIIEGINRIRSGEAEYKLDSDKLHGTNRYLADAVNNIGDGIDNAVKTSVKDERLKSDLITNVSHDIKTPLTSIINYVDLLKRQDITSEPARGYIEILDSKSQRLKELTDDLVEASKITSGNIELKLEVLNLSELLMQTIGEFSEKLEDKKLQVVAETGKLPAFVYGDSRRMWRVMENLFNNICKYAMEGTRVYAEITVEEGRVSLFLKNVSKVQMNIHAEELTERFIRGDSARSTEGSGLGLFIAKSLTNVQGGEFEIQLDADLFKVKITFPLYQPESQSRTPEKSRQSEKNSVPEKGGALEKNKEPETGEENVSEEEKGETKGEEEPKLTTESARK